MGKRIAVVIDSWDYPYNGTVVSTRRFVEALSRTGYEFVLLAVAPSGQEGFSQLSIPGFNGVINAMRAPLARPDRTRIRALLEGCDLLHVQYPFFLARAAMDEARRMGIPVVCSFHVQPENIVQNLRLPSRALCALLYRLFIRWIYGRADRVVAPSPFAADLLIAHGLKRPVSVVSNGVPERYFSVQRVQPERRQGSAGRYRILSVGRLAWEKQQETLLRAVALSPHAAGIEVVLAGVGPREAHLRRLAHRLGVAARIGWIDDDELLSLYGEADLFVHTGTIELEGMSVLEAMAAGNAVVVSDSPASACATLIHEEQARFGKGDPADLARRIDYWYAHPGEAATRGEANRQFARTLSHGRAVRTLVELYDGMIDTTGAEVVERPQLTGTS